MARNGAGVYSLAAGNPVVTGTTISSTTHNNTMTDIATAITNSVAANGETTITADLPLASHKLTGLSAGTAAGNSVRYEQIDTAVTAWTRSATTTLGTTTNGTLSDTSTTITAFNGTAGATYHCRALGAGSITHHATDLIITQGGASITTAAGDTFDIEMITASTCRIKNYQVATIPGTTKSKVINFTRDLSLATSPYAITGAGFKPTSIEVRNSSSGVTYSSGWSDGTTSGATWQVAANTVSTGSSNIGYAAVDGSNYQAVTLTSFDVDGATLTFTKTGSPTGTENFTVLLRR